MFNGDDALRRELLNLRLTVLFPVLDVGVVTDSERATLGSVYQYSAQDNRGHEIESEGRPYSENDCSDSVIKAGRPHSLLVGMGSAGLIRQDEAGTNPHAGCTKHESRSNRLATKQAASSNDLHGLAGQWALVALDELGHCRDKNGGRNITSVSTTFAALCANNICTGIEGLLNMLRVANHVHVEDASSVQLLNNRLRRNSDGGNEEFCAALDNNIDKFIEFALCVVVADWIKSISTAYSSRIADISLGCLTSSSEHSRRPGAATGRRRMGHSCHLGSS